MDVSSQAPRNEWGRSVSELSTNDVPIEVVDAVTMDDLISEAGAEVIDILKIDIEGAEIEVFGNGSLEWLPRVRNIVIELHGQAAKQVFLTAIESEGMTLSRSGELTVCRR
jgi:FkbM family methyltransferase